MRLRLAKARLLLGAALVGVILLAAALAGWLAPFDPIEQLPLPAGRTERCLLARHRSFGRDVLSRMLFGARVSLPSGCWWRWAPVWRAVRLVWWRVGGGGSIHG